MNKDCMTIINHWLSNKDELVGFKVVEKEGHEKRSAWDASKHLVIFARKDSGEIYRIIGSLQNNQWVKINSLGWFKDGYAYLMQIPLSERKINNNNK